MKKQDQPQLDVADYYQSHFCDDIIDDAYEIRSSGIIDEGYIYRKMDSLATCACCVFAINLFEKIREQKKHNLNIEDIYSKNNIDDAVKVIIEDLINNKEHMIEKEFNHSILIDKIEEIYFKNIDGL